VSPEYPPPVKPLLERDPGRGDRAHTSAWEIYIAIQNIHVKEIYRKK
jgi:hypothetical protein